MQFAEYFECVEKNPGAQEVTKLNSTHLWVADKIAWLAGQ